MYTLRKKVQKLSLQKVHVCTQRVHICTLKVHISTENVHARKGVDLLFIKSKFVPRTFSLDSCVLDMLRF